MTGFLSGIRVLDLSQFLPGPYAAQLLGDLGADVVKVEPPGGDPLRQLDPISGGVSPDTPSAFYRVVNGGKRVVFLNLKRDDDVAKFRDLVRRADVLVESYRPGVLDRLGFGADVLKGINPRLIHCALSGYGQTGPHRLRAGHDVNYLAMTGALAATGTQEKPVITWPPVADHSSALYAALAISAALHGRHATGEGAFIDTSLADAGLAWQGWGLTKSFDRAGGLLNGGAACYQLYETKDNRFISIGAVEEKFWQNFCQAIEMPEWAKRQWDPMPQDALIEDVARVIALKTRDDWDDVLGALDVCYHAVLEYDEVATHEHVVARKLLTHTPSHTEVGFPAWVNGEAPSPRASVSDVDLADVIAGWT